MNETLAGNELTPLEKDLLGRFHERYANIGFPALDGVRVTSRKFSTASRWVYLEHDGRVDCADCELYLGNFSQFDCPELVAGASFVVWISSGKVECLEICANGLRPWNGNESIWHVADPDTGLLPDLNSWPNSTDE